MDTTMDAKPSWVQRLLKRTAVGVIGAVTLFLGFGLIACVWRFLDLYERSVMAASVHAKIEMERHQVWMQQVQAARATTTKEGLLQDLDHQASQVPSDVSLPS